jgi:hypothetical protein
MGKWWLTLEGELPLGGTDHGQVARETMLGLTSGTDDARRFAKPGRWSERLTPEELEELSTRDIDPRALEFLSDRSDPRFWALREYNWIRVARDRMDMWRFDESTLDMIQNARNYWAKEGDRYPEITISEASTGDMFRIPQMRLRRLGVMPEALKQIAEGIGKFRNPEPEGPNELKLVFAFAEAGYPVRAIQSEGDILHILLLNEFGGDPEHRTVRLPERYENYKFSDWQEYAKVVFN